MTYYNSWPKGVVPDWSKADIEEAKDAGIELDVGKAKEIRAHFNDDIERAIGVIVEAASKATGFSTEALLGQPGPLSRGESERTKSAPDFVHDIPERGEYIGLRRAREMDAKANKPPPIVDLREPKPDNGLASCDETNTHFLLMCPDGHAARSDSNLDRQKPTRCHQCESTYTWSYTQTNG